jgi:hypothetical protein
MTRLPCLGVNISHHNMESVSTILKDMVERVDIAIIDVKKRIGREVQSLMPFIIPFFDSGIELIKHISTRLYRSLTMGGLTPVATKATIATAPHASLFHHRFHRLGTPS